ncbi:MAG: sucrase ferredoxin [Chloroflexota bacterium]
MAIENRTSADIARANNEPLYGTIKSADVFFLLEYNGVFTHDAWSDARIPSEVKSKLADYPNGRALLIRQPNQLQAVDRKTMLFVVHANAPKPAIYSFELQSYNDVMLLDLDAILAGKVQSRYDAPLYAICTNGRRDECCSKYGIALYNAMIEKEHEHVWQVSHIGGHRFAGTMYCFPHALCYGYLDPDDTDTLIHTYRNGNLWLEKLRGQAIHDKPIQVAEYFLRRELDDSKIGSVQYLSHTEDDGQWYITFAHADTQYTVTIEADTPLQVIATTGDTHYKTVPQFKFVSYESA